MKCTKNCNIFLMWWNRGIKWQKNNNTQVKFVLKYNA